MTLGSDELSGALRNSSRQSRFSMLEITMPLKIPVTTVPEEQELLNPTTRMAIPVPIHTMLSISVPG